MLGRSCEAPHKGPTRTPNLNIRENRLRSISFGQAALFAAFVASTMPAAAQRSADPLAPIVRCIEAGKFRVLEQGRLPASVTSRAVETLEGAKTVTTVDGYRVILATAQGLPFVNLKVEQSATAAAAADRDAVAGQMKALSSRRAPGHGDLQRTSGRDGDVLALHQPSLEAGGPLSLYSIFVPSKAVIATAYVLNQAPGKRAFATYGEYEALRDEAMTLVQRCVAPDGV